MASDGICEVRKGVSKTMNKRFSLYQHLVLTAIFLSIQSVSLIAHANDNAIYQQAWQLIGIDQSSLSDQSKPFFLFTEDGKMYGYGICNYFSGRFKSNSTGEFLITQLNRSNETCEGNDQIEVKLMASILMSNRFKIEDSQLQLLNEQATTVTFEPKNDVNKSALIKQATEMKTHQATEKSSKRNKQGKKMKKKTGVKASSKPKTVSATKSSKTPRATSKSKKLSTKKLSTIEKHKK